MTPSGACACVRHAAARLAGALTARSLHSTFLSEPLDGLQRWQMFVIIITLVFEGLLVSIWM